MQHLLDIYKIKGTTESKKQLNYSVITHVLPLMASVAKMNMNIITQTK